MKAWRLKRTRQCAKCPWRKAVDPREIPGGYSEDKHRALASTIATPARLDGLAGPLKIMACHETHETHCVGWLAHQLGRGNNLALRVAMMTCANAGAIRTVGAQHETFEATLPEGEPS